MSRASTSKASKLTDATAPAGFTLVEMLVVLVVLALISAVVIIKWSGVQHSAVAESAIDRLAFVDQHLRSFARSRGRSCELSFDLQQHLTHKSYRSDDQPTTAPESLGVGVRLAAVRTSPEQPSGREVHILFDVLGRTPTYGVHLSGPGDRQAWLIFAGVSGEMTRCQSERQWHDALELTAPRRL